MKILVIGDPHGNLEKIKKIPIEKEKPDLILLTGDIGKADLVRKKSFENKKRLKKGLEPLEFSKEEIREIHNEIHNSTLDVIKYLSRFSSCYSIQGNVGIPGKKKIKEDKEEYGLKLLNTRDSLKKIKDFHLVQNQFRNFKGVRIGFLEYFVDNSWIKEFNEKGSEEIDEAKEETKKAKRVLERFGENKINILVCHQPPYGCLDKVNFSGVPKDWKGKHAGSKTILDYIKKHKPLYVFCGHIHEGEGYVKIGNTEVYNLGVAGHKFFEV